MPDAKAAIIRSYFAALTAGDAEHLTSLFAEDGYVLSPFLGRVPAREFFLKLTASSKRSVLTVHRVLIDHETGESAAGHFSYEWWLHDGSRTDFEGIDLFEFEPTTNKIRTLSIFYDTYPLRITVGDKYQ